MIHLPTLMHSLADQRPVFHSEADFQHALGWSIRETSMECAVRLERPVPVGGLRVHADIWVGGGGGEELVEVKYKTRQLFVTLQGEEYRLAGQSAQDQGRCAVCKDIWRVEQFVASGAGRSGWVIFLTNDSAYWSSPNTASPVDAAFRLHEGRTVSGTLQWSDSASAGTTGGACGPITLYGSYQVNWQSYSQLGAGGYSEFRFLSIRIAP